MPSAGASQEGYDQGASGLEQGLMRSRLGCTQVKDHENHWSVATDSSM